MNLLLSRQNKQTARPSLPRQRSRKFRVTLWQDSTDTALLTPTPSFTPLRSSTVQQCVGALGASGIKHCVTPAVDIREAQPFIEAGFTLKERLHLLSLDIDPSTDFRPDSEPADLTIRHGRRRHEKAVLKLDNHAFDGFWAFSQSALKESLRATPSSRYRVAIKNKQVIGYAVTGRASNRGYLQRLAVQPELQGQRIGTTLVSDAVHWLRKRGTRKVFVNTQKSNERAYKLYEHLGFEAENHGLVVLTRDTGTP